MQEILLCRHCDTRVIPSSDGICPSCSEDVHKPPATERTRISSEEEEKLLSQFQNLRTTRRILGIGIGLDLFNTLQMSLRREANAYAELAGGLMVAGVLALIMIYLTRKMNQLRSHLHTVTTNET